MTVTNLKQLIEHNPLSMSIEEAAGRRVRKGYQYIPDIPIEEPPLPLKRERKKVKYSDYINPVKTLRKSPTRKRSPVRKYKKARPAKKQKLSEAEEFLQTLNEKKRELEEKLHQINADLADVTQKLSTSSGDEEEAVETVETEEQSVKEETQVNKEPSNDVPMSDHSDKESSVSEEEEGAQQLPEGDQSNKEVSENVTKDVSEQSATENEDTQHVNDNSEENVNEASSDTTETNKATPKKSPKKAKRKKSSKKKERKSVDPKRVQRVTRTSEALSAAEIQAANQVSFTKLLNTLMRHRYSSPFLQPVDPVALNIPDYFTIIKNPMDFGTIKGKLESHNYTTPKEFADDVSLVFTNACTYNQPGSDVYIMATTIQEVFVKKMNTILVKQGYPPLPAVQIPISPITRAPVYQLGPIETPYNELKKSVDSLRKELQNLRSLERNPVKVVKVEKEPLIPMTRDEKRKLSNDINKLSSEHLGMVVKIIKQKMPIGDVDEIVIDIDSLDTATLRDLERYVLKVRKKGTRRGVRRNPQTEPKLDHAARVSQDLTAQRLEDVQKRLEELQRSTEQSLLGNSTTIAFANPIESSDLQNDGDQNSDNDSCASDTDSDASSSESGSDNESASDSESENLE